MKLSNEAKIGILATITILLSVWGYKFLKGQDMLDRTLTIYADYDNAQQINKSAIVYFRGVQIGTVKEILFLPEKKTKATLVLSIKQNPGIPKNAEAILFSAGVLDGKAINLSFDKICNGGDCVQSGDYITGRTMGLLESMIGNPKDMDAYVSKMTGGLNTVFDTLNHALKQPDNEVGKSLRDIQATLVNLRATTLMLSKIMAASAGSLNGTMKNMEGITSNLNANNDKINQMLSNLSDVSSNAKTLDFAKINHATEGVDKGVDELKKTLSETSKALTETTKTLSELTQTFKNVNSGSGTIGQFATNDSVYHSLNMTLLQTQSLMQDLRLNPKRYVNFNPFRKYKPYVVPSKDPLLDTLQHRYNANQKKN